MLFMSESVPFYLRFIKYGMCLCGALIILTACEPDQAPPVVTAPAPVETKIAAEPDIESEVTEIHDEDKDNEESKIDPSVNFLNQQSDPVETEPNRYSRP